MKPKHLSILFAVAGFVFALVFARTAWAGVRAAAFHRAGGAPLSPETEFEAEGLRFRVLTVDGLDAASVEVVGQLPKPEGPEAPSTGQGLLTLGEGGFVVPGVVERGGVRYTITAIGDRAFYNSDTLTGALTLPETVVAIGKYAFYGCKGLSGDLKLPQGLATMGEFAFAQSGLSGGLTIPSGITTIPRGAFYGCSGLRGALRIPRGVIAIDEGAFFGCGGLTGPLDLPDTITFLGTSAFEGCSFDGTLTLPGQLKVVGSRAFWGCPFTGSLIIPGAVNRIEYGAFGGCTGFTGNLQLPESLVAIGEQAFAGCTGLGPRLLLGSALEMVGARAFYGCTGIRTVVFSGKGAPELGAECFGGDTAAACYYPATMNFATQQGLPSQSRAYQPAEGVYFIGEGVASGRLTITLPAGEQRTVTVNAAALYQGEGVPSLYTLQNSNQGVAEVYAATDDWADPDSFTGDMEITITAKKPGTTAIGVHALGGGGGFLYVDVVSADSEAVLRGLAPQTGVDQESSGAGQDPQSRLLQGDGSQSVAEDLQGPQSHPDTETGGGTLVPLVTLMGLTGAAAVLVAFRDKLAFAFGRGKGAAPEGDTPRPEEEPEP